MFADVCSELGSLYDRHVLGSGFEHWILVVGVLGHRCVVTVSSLGMGDLNENSIYCLNNLMFILNFWLDLELSF